MSHARSLSLVSIFICLSAIIAISANLGETTQASASTSGPIITATDSSGRPQLLGIQEADVAVTLHGPLAKTVVTLTFRNNTSRVLEGNLDFPLPEGAALSGYALDMDGVMVDAVPVPKQEARVIYEAEIRKRVDPGLVEQTEGNNFRTRLYPIPAHGTRTVRIESVSQAAPDARGGLRVLVPMHWNQTVPLMRLSLQADAPVTGSLGSLYRDLASTSGRRIKTMENVRADEDLSVTVDNAKSLAWTSGAVVEPFTQASGATGTYFALIGGPSVNRTETRIQSRHGFDRHVGLFWDASLSRRTANTPRELTLLQAVALGRWRDTIVDVTVFRDHAEPVKRFTVRNGDVSALIAYLQAQPFDGGTDLASLPLSDTSCDYNLLFTDGLDTLGGALPSPHGATPLWAIASTSRSDLTGLRYCANRTGGDLIDLTTDVRTSAQIAAAIGTAPLSITSIHVDAGEVRDLTPSGVVPVAANNSVITVAGRLISNTATLTIHYGFPGGAEVATRTITLRKTDAPAVSSGLVGALWAQKRADALAIAPETNRDALITIGREFNIVTHGTSLLVLETLDQHLRYGIAPARSRKALYAAYVSAVEAHGIARANNDRNQLEFAISRWNDRIAWWNKRYPYPGNFQYRDNAGHDNTGANAGGGGSQQSAEGYAPAAVNYMASSTIANRPASYSGGAPIAVSASSEARAAIVRESVHVAHAPAGRALMQAATPASLGVRGGAVDSAGFVTRRKTLGASEDHEAPTIALTIKEWTPNAGYLKSLSSAKSAADAYAAYLKERPSWVDAPSFYFDCAENLHRRGANDLAVRVLTGIADLGLEEPPLLRIVAYRLDEWGYRDRSIALFQEVARLRPEEPQSFRDLALVLAERGDGEAHADPRRAIADYNRALQLLNKVAIGNWDRFAPITDVAVNEANDIIVHARRLPGNAVAKLVIPLDRRLIRNMDCDLRVVMTWDSDNTDMDLHVIEPSHEECYYAHNRTVIGGRLSDDFTQGYGPEEYLVRHGMHGTYLVQSNYFGSREQRLSGGTTVMATVFTDWGRPTEKRHSMALRLTYDKETVPIGNVVVGGKH